MNKLAYQQLRAWTKRRHPKKNLSWVKNRYWQTIGGDNWVFASKEKGEKGCIRLRKHSETPILRHVKVQGTCSPYDGDLVYWSTRMGRHPEVPRSITTLLKRQKGKFTHYGLNFKDGDLKEKDHMISRFNGGTDQYNNLQLLHRHCHDKKTAQDAVDTKRARHKSMPPKPKKVKEVCATSTKLDLLRESRSMCQFVVQQPSN